MTYQIIFHDGKSVDITEQQKDAIYQLSGNPRMKGVDINGEFIFFGSIARIMKSANQPSYPLLPTINQTLGGFSLERKKRALGSMIKGFKKVFEGREMPIKSRETLNKMQIRYDNCN